MRTSEDRPADAAEQPEEQVAELDELPELDAELTAEEMRVLRLALHRLESMRGDDWDFEGGE